MLSLSRAHATGVLSVRSETALCRLAVVDGCVRAAVSNAVDVGLGDMLVRDAGLPPRRLVEALEHTHYEPPFGAWLLQRGFVSRETVAHSLRAQLHERVRSMFRWPRHVLRFDPGTAEIGVYWLREPLAMAPLILNGMRHAIESQPRTLDRADPRVFELTAWGSSLLSLDAVSDGERAWVEVLQRGAAAGAVLAAAEQDRKFELTWDALVAFRAIAPRRTSRVDYTLLLRKRAQLQRRAGARELLDLPAGVAASPAAARVALRRLTLHLHPDRLGPDAPESARVLSTEVMRALTRAASSFV